MKIKFHWLAILYRPVLSLLGIKSKTVAGKAADIIDKVDKIVEDEKKTK